MSPLKIAVILGAIFCVTIALAIGYRKWVIPWQDERDWQRRTLNAKKLQLQRDEVAKQRRAAVKGGRTERRMPGDRNVAS